MFEFVELLERGDVEKVAFHACMFGSQRNKLTSLVAPRGVFFSMSVKRDGQQEHFPCGVSRQVGGRKFARKDECEYPRGICDKIAELAARAYDVRQPGF